jgi:hypothetical protein
MRTRLVLGGLAAALALGTVAPAHADVRPACMEPGDLLCTVLALTCILEPGGPCHP